MSLDWNIEKVKDYKKACWEPDPNDPGEERLAGTTHCIIWATMAVHLGSITEKNVDEWMRRIGVLKKLNRELGWKLNTETSEREEYWPSREEITAHIGLRTNMSNKPFKSWTKMLMDNIVRDVDWELRNEREKETSKDAA